MNFWFSFQLKKVSHFVSHGHKDVSVGVGRGFQHCLWFGRKPFIHGLGSYITGDPFIDCAWGHIGLGGDGIRSLVIGFVFFVRLEAESGVLIIVLTYLDKDWGPL